MNDDARPVCVVLGVGPVAGLGAALCRRFAAGGQHVLVAGRTQDRLDAVVAAIEADGGTATAMVADATREPDVVALFERAAGLGRLETAIYNAGNNTPGRIAEMDADYFERAWRLCCFGGFLFGREAVRRWQDGPPGARSLLFTGASASLRGRAGFGAFNSGKGGLRLLAQAMAKEYGADGVHVAHVVVDGGIEGDKIIKGVPQFAEKVGPDGLIALDGLADAYWFLHGQPRQAWSFELDLRTYRERW
jgi:NAD(P)-dependent dehydrogenase (short-subunit alcohol dehydrogenase family)